MRIALKFRPEAPLVLPKSYQNKVQGFIYGLIKDKTFGNFLHEQGFGEERTFKLFTFSLLKGPYTYDDENHTVTYKEHFYLEISTLVDDLIHHLTKTLLGRGELRLAGIPLALEEYRIIDKEIKEASLLVEMMSPVCVYSTVHIDGRPRTHYYAPSDKNFQEQVRANFERKYRSAFREPPDNTIEIEPVEVEDKDKLVMKYRKQVIIAYKGKYRLRGKPEHLDFLYRTGLGSKNFMGFGMFRPCR